MSKKEIVQEIKTSILALSVYDSRYYKVEQDSKYMRSTKRQLEVFLLELQNRLLFSQKAEKLGANICKRSDLRGKDIQLIVKSGIVCRNVGVGFVEERVATDQDIKTMIVII